MEQNLSHQPAPLTHNVSATDSQLQKEETSHSSSIWHINRLRMRNMTLMPDANISESARNRTYLLRRPRALQYYIGGEFIDAEGHRRGPADIEKLTRHISDEQTEIDMSEKRLADDPLIFRGTVLFILLQYCALLVSDYLSLIL